MDYRFSLLTFFLGLFLGHRFALGRDKRKEFNSVAKEFDSKLYDYLESDNSSYLPNIKSLELFAPQIDWVKRSHYLSCVKQLSDSLESDKNAWEVINPDSGECRLDKNYVSGTKTVVTNLRKYMRRK
ncbi:hypothetical protein AB4347_00010 [Vibrio breoganii]|uniref:hypothetical protein n=1 Tax=Vibrio breoganii TaxID=553239 RepID=UPI000C83D95B|nr:hypothetical protein [Vibrio breoganii]PMG04010.1 hypothetical protein BCV08_06705 [Vibrio breoganii]PMK59320.1 hypothetical protein BCT98_06030 [Vibrio breoganii]PMK69119.1 hypothetical protein BCT94_02285 [Vibrio breoganii]